MNYLKVRNDILRHAWICRERMEHDAQYPDVVRNYGERLSRLWKLLKRVETTRNIPEF